MRFPLRLCSCLKPCGLIKKIADVFEEHAAALQAVEGSTILYETQANLCQITRRHSQKTDMYRIISGTFLSCVIL
jgi:hypothetical protein